MNMNITKILNTGEIYEYRRYKIDSNDKKLRLSS